MKPCKCENVSIYDNEHRCMLCFARFVRVEDAVMEHFGIEIINQEPVEDSDERDKAA